MTSTHHKYQFVVICSTCGIQPLTHDNYVYQLSRPNRTWQCPKCGCEAHWDDECLETNPVQPEEDETVERRKAEDE